MVVSHRTQEGGKERTKTYIGEGKQQHSQNEKQGNKVANGTSKKGGGGRGGGGGGGVVEKRGFNISCGFVKGKSSRKKHKRRGRKERGGLGGENWEPTKMKREKKTSLFTKKQPNPGSGMPVKKKGVWGQGGGPSKKL